MSVELDRLTQEVADTKSSVDSVIALVEGLAQQIRDSVNDPAALNALADELDAQQGRIAAAVSANTPTPPAEPPVEPPAEPPAEPPVDETPPVDDEA